MDIADHFVFRGVDVATDDTGALALASEVLQLLFVFADKTDRGFHLGFDGLAEREILFAAPSPVFVVNTVYLQQGLVADVSEPLRATCGSW